VDVTVSAVLVPCLDLPSVVHFISRRIASTARRWRLYAGAGEGTQVPPPNLAVLLTHCGQLILRNISKFDATRCQIMRLKCTNAFKTEMHTITMELNDTSVQHDNLTVDVVKCNVKVTAGS